MNKNQITKIESEGFKQVSKDEFYKTYIGKRDICVTSRGYNYSRFETRNNLEVGRIYSLDHNLENDLCFIKENLNWELIK